MRRSTPTGGGAGFLNNDLALVKRQRPKLAKIPEYEHICIKISRAPLVAHKFGNCEARE